MLARKQPNDCPEPALNPITITAYVRGLIDDVVIMNCAGQWAYYGIVQRPKLTESAANPGREPS